MTPKSTCFSYRAPGKCDCLKELSCDNCRFYKSKNDTANNARMESWHRPRLLSHPEPKGATSK